MTTPTADVVRAYYGAELGGQHDLKTGACCATEALSPRLQAIAQQIHPEVVARFYGCGAPI
ncbi:hypothetical protein J8J40_21875, partial [Mycobacterium tuberculosis]|nr:hypothetical protein [Mycobacterium tuberculosis]